MRSGPPRTVHTSMHTYCRRIKNRRHRMNSHWISIGALIGMFVLATALPINMGLLAFVGAFLVGTLVAGMGTKAIIGGFPADLFLTLAGITHLFALAQNRSEEHTSELQSQSNLVCRLLLEKKKKKKQNISELIT